jgi:hypothetical protein
VIGPDAQGILGARKVPEPPGVSNGPQAPNPNGWIG